MNRILKLIAEGSLLVWGTALLIALAAGYFSSELARNIREFERIAQLETEAERRSVELVSQTLNGNVMGAIGLLGMTDPDLKREALGKLDPNNAKVADLLENVTRSFDAAGLFIVNGKGIIGSAWYTSGKPSTGRSVQFRAYYQMAMQGINNVYAAVGTGSRERILYYGVPIFSGSTNGTDVIGTLVARVEMHQVDNLLRDRADIALLLSPQGVVFASNRKELIGHLSGKPTPERIQAIRDLKQFGNMFDSQTPPALPFSIEPGRIEHDGRRHALTHALVQWNDPLGDWKLVLIEDLGRTVPAMERGWIGLGTFLIVLLIAFLILKALQSSYQQRLTNKQLQEHARLQVMASERKGRLASAAVSMQRTKSLLELSQAFLYESHAMLGALQGSVYVVENEGSTLRLTGSYACARRPKQTIAFGEGLLGQCAVEQQLLVHTGNDSEGFMLRSGLGETRPAALMIAPVMLANKLLGVVELALIEPPKAEFDDLLKELAALLAMNIEIVSRTALTVAQLSATQAQDTQLTEQLHFQQALVDTIPYPVFYKGPDTRFLGFNRAYEETFKVRREDLTGKRVIDLDYLPEADRIAYQAEDEATIASVGTVRRPMRIPFADGKLHDTIYFVSGFRQADGSPGGLVGTFIDMGVVNAEPQS